MEMRVLFTVVATCGRLLCVVISSSGSYVTGVLKCNSYLQNKCHSMSLRIQLMAGHWATIEEERTSGGIKSIYRYAEINSIRPFKYMVNGHIVISTFVYNWILRFTNYREFMDFKINYQKFIIRKLANLIKNQFKYSYASVCAWYYYIYSFLLNCNNLLLFKILSG